jgi:hypothetical protein
MSDEKPKEPNNYRRRYSNRAALKKYVELLIGQLTELERKTDPAGGPDTAHRKDFAAFEALEFAGKLIEALAGWAIDHQIGLAIKGLQFVPLQPSGTQKHPEYLNSRSIVDDHAHERAGASVSTADLTPEIMRKIWVNLLNANPCGVGYHLRASLWLALRALDYGEVHPIFEPKQTTRKRNLTELTLQLRAVAIVEYRRTRRPGKSRALKEVASALGVSVDTIRSWEPRLRAEFGALEVDRGLSFARNAASNENHAERQTYKLGRATDGFGRWESQYGDQALEMLAESYKAALRLKK